MSYCELSRHHILAGNKGKTDISSLQADLTRKKGEDNISKQKYLWVGSESGVENHWPGWELQMRVFDSDHTGSWNEEEKKRKLLLKKSFAYIVRDGTLTCFTKKQKTLVSSLHSLMFSHSEISLTKSLYLPLVIEHQNKSGPSSVTKTGKKRVWKLL